MPEQALSHLALYTARPTIRVNGAANSLVTSLLLSMEMVEGEGGLSALELRLTNFASLSSGSADFAFEDETALKLGDQIAVYAGDETAPTQIFSGFITGLEADFPENGAPTLTVLAEDRLQQARLNRRTRTFTDVSVADIARAIASDLGLTPVVTGLDETLPVEVQMNESDLGFLRRLLARFDADLQMVGDEIHVAPRSEVHRDVVELALHSQLRSATVLADLSQQTRELTVTGWDPTRGERVTGRSNGTPPGPGRGRSPRDLMLDNLIPHTLQMNPFAVATNDEAVLLSARRMGRILSRFVVLNGVAEGNPNMRVGSSVSATGLGPRFSNTYYLTRCRHHFDLKLGYETDFTGECAFLGRP